VTPMNDKLRQFAGGYFHEDYDAEFSTVDEAIDRFREESSSDSIDVVVRELSSLLDSPLTEEDLDDLWINQLHANYDPREDGMTYREWFAHVRDLLTQAKAE